MSQEQTPSNAATEKPAGEGTTTTTEPVKTFTQDDVDRIVQERLKRDREKNGDVDELRKKAARLDELEAAQKTELEKATEAVTAATTRAEQAEAALKDERIKNAITAAASTAGFIDPSDAARFVDQSDIEFDGDQPKNLDKLLGSLAKAKPHLVKEGGTTTGSGDGGPQGSTPTTKDPAQMFGDIVAEKLGR